MNLKLKEDPKLKNDEEFPKFYISVTSSSPPWFMYLKAYKVKRCHVVQIRTLAITNLISAVWSVSLMFLNALFWIEIRL